MKLKKKNLLTVTIVLLSVTILLLSITVLRKIDNSQEKSTDTDVEELSEKLIISNESVPEENTPEVSAPPDQKIQIGAWIAYWDLNGALTTYRANKEAFTSLSPTWYFQQSDGSLGLKNTARNAELRELCNKNNTKLIPSISNLNPDSLSGILNDQELLAKHINSIVSEVLTYEYDGIDIDYEAIKSSDKDKFTEFIKLLAEELHNNDKVLTIAILWKNDLDIFIDAFSESRAAQDWVKIGKYVDEFRIMAYDYTGSTDKAGPIAPYNWIRSILDYAVEHVDTERIVLALPLYAYEWIEGKKGAKVLVWSDVQNVQNITSNELDATHKEKKLTYKIGNTTKIIWYQDAEATEKRIDLARTYGVFKFSFWRLGGEDPMTYQIPSIKS